MNKQQVLNHLKNKFIKQGYVKNGCVPSCYFPESTVNELLDEGLIEIRNSVIPTIVLCDSIRNELLNSK